MADDDGTDPTASFNELEPFDSLWQALKWTQVKKRLPICFKKTIRNRYFLANIVYLIYAIGILLIDFHFSNLESAEDQTEDFSCNSTALLLNLTATESNGDRPISLVNQLFIALAVVHVVSATLYWWAWKDHRWNDVVMIPEYLNHIEAGLYLWSAIWYIREDGLCGYYTLALHKIETVAAFVELFASFGWIMSWYRTYTRTIGRGYSLDDPDTIAYTLTTVSSFIYITYNIQILVNPEEYGQNSIYYYGDVIYSAGAFFYLWANLRDDGWLWWLPVAGQYGIAPGTIRTDKPVKTGLSHLLIGGSEPCTRCCKRRPAVHPDNKVVMEDL